VDLSSYFRLQLSILHSQRAVLIELGRSTSQLRGTSMMEITLQRCQKEKSLYRLVSS